MYGPHLTLDLYEVDEAKLADLKEIYDFLDKLPAQIEMNKITQPYVFTYRSEKKPEDWGLTGFVIIAESHISIHTYPAKNYASVDVFSCKEFDPDKTADIIVSWFGAGKWEKHSFQRGKDFPHDIAKASKIVLEERKATEVPLE